MLGPGGPRRDPGGPDLERHRFWRGQHLKARDVNAVAAGEEERQWWHNRAVHRAYGVVDGLGVRPAVSSPGVRVEAGLAYDAYGRALAVSDPTVVAPPAGAGEERDEAWALVLRHPGGDGGLGACRRGAGSGGGELTWRRARRVAPGDGVVLARGSWIRRPGGLVFAREEDHQNVAARPVARPRLGQGRTPPGATLWRTWSETLGDPNLLRRPMRGIEVTIDTAAAGFTRVPCYFAWLQGGPWQVGHRLATAVPVPRIHTESRRAFTFSLWDPVASLVVVSNDRPEAALQPFLRLARQRLFVCWLGIEGDPPAPRSRRWRHQRVTADPRKEVT